MRRNLAGRIVRLVAISRRPGSVALRTEGIADELPGFRIVVNDQLRGESCLPSPPERAVTLLALAGMPPLRHSVLRLLGIEARYGHGDLNFVIGLGYLGRRHPLLLLSSTLVDPERLPWCVLLGMRMCN